MALFGQYDLSKVYRETINVCLEDIRLSHLERSLLYTVACLCETTTGICYEPGSHRPANFADLLEYASCDLETLRETLHGMARMELIQIWDDRGRMLITLNEYIRSSLVLIHNDNAPPALCISRREDGVGARTARRFGYVYIARAENGLYKIGRAKDPAARVRGFAGAVMPFVVELVHTIRSSDYIQAESFLHQRYAHCRRVGEWFQLSERDLDKILEIRELDF